MEAALNEARGGRDRRGADRRVVVREGGAGRGTTGERSTATPGPRRLLAIRQRRWRWGVAAYGCTLYVT